MPTPATGTDRKNRRERKGEQPKGKEEAGDKDRDIRRDKPEGNKGKGRKIISRKHQKRIGGSWQEDRKKGREQFSNTSREEQEEKLHFSLPT